MSFQFRPAKREQTPLLVGLTGPTWTGKTYSALRLATGIVSVRGGQIVGIDTEAGRMLQYADEFTFSYLKFGAPFSSLRYSDAMKEAAEEAKGGCVIVDSMSHEHEGPGGYLCFHEEEVKRLCKEGGFRNEYSAQIPAWNKPAQRRRTLINTMLQLDCAFIFCFRAKEKIKPVKGGSPLELGWQAIAGEEFGFEMTARCLLVPGAKGVPTWTAEAEKLGVPKCIASHEKILKSGRQLDEEAGKLLAEWAAGKDMRVAPTATGGAPTAGERTPDPSDADSPLAFRPATAAPVDTALITADEALALEARCADQGINIAALKKAAKVDRLSLIRSADLARAHQWIDAVLAKRKLGTPG